MQWTVKVSETALKVLEKINKPEQLRIRAFINNAVMRRMIEIQQAV